MTKLLEIFSQKRIDKQHFGLAGLSPLKMCGAQLDLTLPLGVPHCYEECNCSNFKSTLSWDSLNSLSYICWSEPPQKV